MRLCGDYVRTAAYLHIPQIRYDKVLNMLEKVRGFKIFADIDMKNAFHQFKIDQVSSERLALVTPWGHVRPVVLPEGIGPASGMLQRFVSTTFADFEKWSIVLFDNFLILAVDLQDLYDKVSLLLKRWLSVNLVLNMNKSFFRVKSVNFFGYL